MTSRTIDYAVILDAGSSGTRLYIYKWQSWHIGDSSPPVIENVYTVKQNGGIAEMINGSDLRYEAMKAFEEALLSKMPGLETKKVKEAVEEIFHSKDLQSRVNAHLERLFEDGRKFLANIKVEPKKIPLFLLGTAGIRDLCGNRVEGKKMYADLLRCMMTSTQSAGFDLKECGAISGEAEALYGWIAANYSLGFFSGYGLRLSETVGYVEMGGASAQIAFSPYKVHQDYKGKMWKVRIGSLDFDLFLGSYQFGMDVAMDTYHAELTDPANVSESEVSTKIIKDPGKPRGFKEQVNGWQLEGHPNYGALETRVFEVLENLEVTEPKFDSALTNALKAHKFVGGANFWYSTRQIFGIDINGEPKKTAFSFTEFRNEVLRTSQLHWQSLKERRPGVNEKFLSAAWFKAAWVECVLTKYFGFAGTNAGGTEADRLSFRPYNGADGVELNWTLGRLIHYITGNKPPAQMKGEVILDINKLRKDAREADREARSHVEIGLEYLHQTRNKLVSDPIDPAIVGELISAGYVEDGFEARGTAKLHFDKAGELAAKAISVNDQAERKEKEEIELVKEESNKPFLDQASD